MCVCDLWKAVMPRKMLMTSVSLVTQQLNYFFFGKYHNVDAVSSVDGPEFFDVNFSCHREFHVSTPSFFIFIRVVS